MDMREVNAALGAGNISAPGVLPRLDELRDWVYGEVSASGRSRPMMVGVMDCLMRFAGTPVGQSKLAREARLAVSRRVD